MLRKNFSRKIEIDAILKYLELITKFVAVMIIIATVIGGLNIYSYLKDINHLFLFSDVIGISYASVSALVSYFLFVVMIAVGFLSPFIMTIFLFLISDNSSENRNQANKKTNNNQQSVFNPSQKLLEFINKIKSLLQFIILCISPICLILIPLLPIILVICTICFLLFYIANLLIKELFFGKENKLSFTVLSKFVHWVSFLCTISITLIVFFSNDLLKIFLYGTIISFALISCFYTSLFIKNMYNKKVLVSEKLFLIIPFSFIPTTPSLLHFLLVVYPTANIVKYEIAFILFHIFSILLFGLSCLLSHIAIYDYFQEKTSFLSKKYDMRLIFTNLAPVLLYVFYLLYFSNQNISLYTLRFIEKPKNSSWYLIHNGNTTSDKINGFDTKQINILKKEFSKSYQCTGIEGNILYGYMAWNLGNTKVFCPQSVDFFDNAGDNKEKSEKCLVIDGKYLQPISAKYVSAW